MINITEVKNTGINGALSTLRQSYPDFKIAQSYHMLNDGMMLVEARIYKDYKDTEGAFIANSYSACELLKLADNPEMLTFSSHDAVLQAVELITCALNSMPEPAVESSDDETPKAKTAEAMVCVAEEAEQSENPPEADSELETVPESDASTEQGESENQELVPAEATGEQAENTPYRLTPVPETPAPCSNISEDMDVETLINLMTLDDALKYKITFGRRKNLTMAELAQQFPDDIKWFVNEYRGPNNIIRVAARILLNESEKKTA